jgi:hypothetical protein
MRPDDLFGFNSATYRQRIKTNSPTTLENNIYRKWSQITGSMMGIGTSLTAAHFTIGLSLVGTGLSARRLSVAAQKLKILEQEWIQRGNRPLPQRANDHLIPITISMLSLGLGDVLTLGGSDAITHAGHHAIHHLTSQSTSSLTNGHVTNFLAQGGQHGVSETVKIVASGGHHTYHAAGGLIGSQRDIYDIGQMAGMEATRTVLDTGIERGTYYAARKLHSTKVSHMVYAPTH